MTAISAARCQPQLGWQRGTVHPLVQFAVTGGKLIIDMSEADGFLSDATSGTPIQTTFGFAATWAPDTGLHVTGGGAGDRHAAAYRSWSGNDRYALHRRRRGKQRAHARTLSGARRHLGADLGIGGPCRGDGRCPFQTAAAILAQPISPSRSSRPMASALKLTLVLPRAGATFRSILARASTPARSTCRCSTSCR